MKIKAPNSLGLAGDSIQALHKGLNEARATGKIDMPLSKAIEKGIELPNGSSLTLSDGIKTGKEMIDYILADLGVDSHSISLGALVKLPEGQRWIVPELFLEIIEDGMRQNNDFYQAIVGDSQTSKDGKFTQPQIGPYTTTGDGLNSGGIGTTPDVVDDITFSSRELKGTKFERKLRIPWEVSEFATLDLLSKHLERISKVWGLQLTRKAITVLMNGDAIDASLAPATVGVDDTTNKLQWVDLMRLLARGGRLGFNYTTVISQEAQAVAVVNLPEFKNRQQGSPLGGVSLQGRIPSQWDYFMHSIVPTSKYVFLDPDFALREMVAGGLRIESDNNVDLDLTSTYVRMHHAYANIERQARVLVDESVTIIASPFPAWMSPID